MHDIDHTQLEFESEEEFEGFETEDEDEFESEYDNEFEESEDEELASSLLEIQDEEELEQFLGSLVKKAARAAGGFLKSGTGKALVGILKKAAKKALPIAGSALGSAIGGPLGGKVGGKLASSAGKALGLELEGMDEQEAEFEVAKRIIRLTKDAARTAATTQSSSPTAALSAVQQAARKYLPGLVGRTASHGRAQSGRWVRRGRRIVLMGV